MPKAFSKYVMKGGQYVVYSAVIYVIDKKLIK